jgi:3-oxoacyl-[acyl-carrier protein] reductase
MVSPSDPAPGDRPVAFVTGSTRGIGWACARAFAASGHAVVVNGVTDAAAIDSRAAEIERDYGVPALGIRADAADPEAVAACYRTIFQRFRRLDVLVNNAGVLGDGRIGMIPAGTVDRAYAVNASGALHHLQNAARLMLRGKGGAVVNLASIMGARGAAGAAAYAMAKAAVIGLTLSAAKELGPVGIRVNAVAPGMIETDLIAGLPPAIAAERLKAIPLGRFGTPEEVAEAVLFLARAGYVTGQVLGVDGGMVW